MFVSPASPGHIDGIMMSHCNVELFTNIMTIAGTYTSASLLGSDWRQVSHEAWAELNDDEYEEEEEEIYVTVDLGTYVSPTVLMRADECQLVGLDTPTPWLKIGNHVYRGIHDRLIGSEILLRTEKDADDPLHATHTPFSSTNRRITCQPMIPKSLANNKPSEKTEKQEVEPNEEDDERPDPTATIAAEVLTETGASMFDPEAPYGRTKTGAPKKRPGAPRVKRAPRPMPIASTSGQTSSFVNLDEYNIPTSPPEESHPISEADMQIPEDGLPTQQMSTRHTRSSRAPDGDPGPQAKLQKKIEAMQKSVEAEVLGLRRGRRKGTKVTPILPGFQGSEKSKRKARVRDESEMVISEESPAPEMGEQQHDDEMDVDE